MEALHGERERERGERYRALYELLDLKATVHKDGTLDVSGTFGLREMRHGGEPTSAWMSVTGEGQEIPPPDDPYEDEEDRCHDRRGPRRTRSPPSSRRWP